jgi:FMN-dependent NADH-azoreductase
MKLLHIIASPRKEKSRTLAISQAFLTAFQAEHPGMVVEELDLTAINLPPISGEIAEAKYVILGGGALSKPAQSAWDRIVSYSQAFLQFDYYLISSPMWNFSIPYQLKHYIDIIMQPGILFRFAENGVEGLAKNKKMFCITSRGSDYSPGSYMNQFDYQEPYLRSIFGMAGIHDITFLHAQAMDIAPLITESNLSQAISDTKILAQRRLNV